MSGLKNSHWSQWDAQDEARRKREQDTQDWIELNNTYLRIERGCEALTITNSNRMRVLAGKISEGDDTQLNYWQAEFEKLPNWLNV